MYYKFDIDWGSLPLSFALVGETDNRNDLWYANTRTKMLAQLRQHLSEDGIGERDLLMWFKEFKRKCCEQRGHLLAPTPTGANMIKLLYDRIAPYREMVETMRAVEYEVKKTPELYRIYEVLHNVMDIYDNYCMDLDEFLASSPKKTAEPTIASGDRDIVPVDAGEGVEAVREVKDVATIVSTTDFSHMRSFTPEIAFDMSALYTLLVNEGVLVNIDEKLFADCISHAHVNELWEMAGKHRKRNLMQCLFKMLAQGWYSKEWILTCASNLKKNVKHITNPTWTGVSHRFEDKLWAVLRGKKQD